MSQSDIQPELMRIPDVAAMLQISRSQAYDLVAKRLLPCVQIGRSKRVPRQAVLDYIARMTIPATPQETRK